MVVVWLCVVVILAVVMRVMRYGVVPQMDTGMRVAAVPLDALVDLTRTHTIHHDGDGDDAHDDSNGEGGILRRVVPSGWSSSECVDFSN